MSSFEKLLDKVRKASPNLISEEDATAMLNDYNAFNDQQVAQATASGFKEGYDAGVESAKAETMKEMYELLAKCDEDATTKLQTIVDMLNNEHAEKLQEVYDTLMKKSEETTDAAVSNALAEMDEDHAEKFAQALEAKDADCTKKLKIAVESVVKKAKSYIDNREAFHNTKFDAYKTVAESRLADTTKKLEEEKARKLDVMAESVNKYLNYALQNAIPTKKLISETKYNASQKAIEKISSILKINSIIQESKDGIFQDYESKLAAAKDSSNKLIAENTELKNELQKKEAKLLLESKIASCTPAEAAYLRSYFMNADSKKIIEEQIEAARSAYKRIHEEKRQQMVEKVNTSVKPSSTISESKTVKKEEPSKKVVTEPVEKAANDNDSLMAIYASMLKKN